MNKHIFIINGSGGVGKDTFVKMVAKSVIQQSPPNNIYQVWNYSSIDKVKAIATQIGWNGSKTEKDRKFLSDLKMFATEYNDMPFNDLKDKVESFMESKKAVFLFLHIREPKEIERAKKEFSAATILVTRSAIPQIISNIADGSVFNYKYDVEIANDGTKDELQASADLFVKEWFGSQCNRKEEE